MTYRPDIDGLRAIAVLAVVLFHLNVPLFSGGFIGVDVFFVISGFLMTNIIDGKCKRGSFSFSDFYLRRLRRLMPALVVTIAITFIGAAALFSPEDLIAMARSAVAAQFSISNILFYFEAGYWDSASELKPLLHTWSLGVEEQFYLFWPALIVFLAGANRRKYLMYSMLLLAVSATILTVWFTAQDQSGAFYLLPFRVNQFALGALVVFVARTPAYHRWQQHRWLRLVLGLLGLALVLYSAIVFNGDTIFPGWAVLTPTLGTVLLLLSGSGGGQVQPLQQLLANPVCVWFGKVSYSMYLVHWPLITLYRYHHGLHLSPSEQLGLGLTILLFTVGMHHLVEKRFYARDHGASGNGPGTDAHFARRLALVMALCTVAPVTAWLGDGWAWRYSGLVLTPEQIAAGKAARFTYTKQGCRVEFSAEHPACNPSAPTQLLLLGNSHEPDGFNFFHSLLNGENSVDLVSFGTINKCKNLRQESGVFLSDDAACQKRLDALFTEAGAKRFKTVVYSSHQPFAFNKAELQKMLYQLKALNPQLQIITMGGYIQTQRECAFYMNEYHTSAACSRKENVTYFGDTPSKRTLYEPIMSLSDYHIDMVELLCPRRMLEACLTQTKDGVPAFYDRHHLSLEFAVMAGQMYREQNPDFITHILRRTDRH